MTYTTHLERMRKIRNDRNTPTPTVPRAVPAANTHGDDDTAARDRFLRDIKRRPR